MSDGRALRRRIPPPVACPVVRSGDDAPFVLSKRFKHFTLTVAEPSCPQLPAPTKELSMLRMPSSLIGLVVAGALAAGPVAAIAAPAQGLEVDCSRFKCTVRFDRDQTRQAMTPKGFTAALSAACAAAEAEAGCGTNLALSQELALMYVRMAYDRGNCLALKFVVNRYGLGQMPFAGVIWPKQVEAGTYNCP